MTKLVVCCSKKALSTLCCQNWHRAVITIMSDASVKLPEAEGKLQEPGQRPYTLLLANPSPKNTLPGSMCQLWQSELPSVTYILCRGVILRFMLFVNYACSKLNLDLRHLHNPKAQSHII